MWADYGVIAAEMEASALYTVAGRYRKKALTIMTVVVDATAELGEREGMKDESIQIDNEQKQNGLDDMILLGLETLIR